MCVCVHVITVCVIRLMTVTQQHKPQGRNEMEKNQCMRGRALEKKGKTGEYLTKRAGVRNGGMNRPTAGGWRTNREVFCCI